MGKKSSMIAWARNHKGGYECSSKGDKRFSAFYARMPDGRTIEQHYQCDVKGYDVGGNKWELGKGKPPLYTMSEKELYFKYLSLWMCWASNNFDTLRELYVASKDSGVLTDCFASGKVNQARALADILNILMRDEDGKEK